MGVKFAVDFSRPSVPECCDRAKWLLPHAAASAARANNAAPPRAIAVSNAHVVPNDEVNTLENIGDSLVISLRKP